LITQRTGGTANATIGDGNIAPNHANIAAIKNALAGGKYLGFPFDVDQ